MKHTTVNRQNEIPEKGLPKEAVLHELETKLQGDLTYSCGKILGSMCTQPSSFAKQVYLKYLETNLGDPGLFPATADLEKEVIDMLGHMLSIDSPCGHIVSGGTEANLLAMWAARNLANKKRGEVVVPVSAHYSFDKAADLLNLKLIKVKLDSNYQMDISDVKKAITPNTVALVGIAGTTGLGVVDPIPELSELAVDKDIFLHVDAAFGGFVLPFLKELGSHFTNFDFRLPGVCSITIDPHKMGLAPIPAGGILFRDESLMKAVTMNVPYLSGGHTEQSTIIGTRLGASSIAVWALLMNLGKDGYKKVVRCCLNLTMQLVRGIEKIDGVDVVAEPVMNVVGLKSEVMAVEVIAQKLRQKGWAISLFSNYLRLVVMPHVTAEHIQSFLKDLKEIMEKGDN